MYNYIFKHIANNIMHLARLSRVILINLYNPSTYFCQCKIKIKFLSLSPLLSSIPGVMQFHIIRSVQK
jgi:hypothetical protein